MRIPATITSSAYGTLLVAPRRVVASRVTVLDRNEDPIGATVPVISGQVSVDASGDVTRTAELSAVDPERKLGFDGGSPGAGALYADRFVQIDYGIADAAGVVHWLGIFRGPIVHYERSHPEITISAQGKESLGLAPNLPAFKGTATQVVQSTRIDNAIAALAGTYGEQRIDCPQIPQRLGRTLSVGRNKEPWPIVRKVAADAGFQAFYDGDGWLRIRRRPAKVVWSFADELLTWPRVSYDLGDDFRNIVRVTGRARSGRSGNPPSFVAEAAPGDPLSPRSLAHNGQPRYVAEYLEVEATDTATCKRIAQSTLANRMRQSVSVEFDCLTVPGLEEGDPVQVTLPGETTPIVFVAQRFAFGLGTDQMTVGTVKRVRTQRRLA